MTRTTKAIPEFVYFWQAGAYVAGPFVRPQSGRQNRKFLLTEVPMDPTKPKKTKTK